MFKGEPAQEVKNCINCQREFTTYVKPYEVEYCSIECYAACEGEEEKSNTGHEIPEAIMRQTYHF